MTATTTAAATGVAAAMSAAAVVWRYASLSPESQLFGKTLVGGNDPREAALTYDDGPNGDLTLRLMDVLAERNAPGAFFLIGKYVREQPQIVRRLVEAGHTVGNHTMSHPMLTSVSAARIRAELTDCNAAIEDAIGAPVRYFRPPHGARRPAVMRIARELGLTPVLWNATGYDWNRIAADEIAGNILEDAAGNRRRGHGSNVLLHDGSQFRLGEEREATVAATAMVIDRMRAREMRFVKLERWG